MKMLGKVVFSLAVASSLMWGYSDTVYQVQSQLTNLGYNAGTPDGLSGKGTARAIRQYQKDNDLSVNGRVTNELLMSLGVNQRSSSQSTTRRSSYQASSGESFFGKSSLTNSFKNGKYQVGFLAAWPSYGMSLKMDYSDKMTFEVVAAPMGTLSIYSAKANYYLTKQRQYNTYAYATGGVGMYEGFDDYDYKTGSYETQTETVPMFGAGVGLEWSWKEFMGGDFPDLYSTVEFGYASMSFDYYNFGGLIYGGGIYYKF